MTDDHYKAVEDARLIPDGPDAIEEARKMHRLATADPEPERGDGTLTGAAHELKYGLERAEETVKEWVARGVHPTENRALKPGDEGYEGAVEAGQVPAEEASSSPSLETAVAPNPPENADAPKAG